MPISRNSKQSPEWTECRQRSDWLPALAALEADELAAVVEPLLSHYALEHKALPEDGLGLLKIRDGSFNQPFYLGEFPVATASLLLHTEQGQAFAGAAQYLGDDAEKAVYMAVCDAILNNALPEAASVHKLVRAGQARLLEVQRERRGILERTRVDFNLLGSGETGGEDDL